MPRTWSATGECEWEGFREDKRQPDMRGGAQDEKNFPRRQDGEGTEGGTSREVLRSKDIQENSFLNGGDVSIPRLQSESRNGVAKLYKWSIPSQIEMRRC
jgi:hypothetical protein